MAETNGQSKPAYQPADPMGGMKVRLSGRAGNPFQFAGQGGEQMQGVNVMFFGGNQTVMVSDDAVFESIRPGDWIEADATLITKKSGLSIGERFDVATVNGVPVDQVVRNSVERRMGSLPDRGRTARQPAGTPA